MGFFKDFKEDFSQALNELLPGEDYPEADDIQINTLDNELDVEQELSKLDGLLEQVEKKSAQPEVTPEPPVEEEPELAPLDELEFKLEAEAEPEPEAAEPEAEQEVEPEPETTEPEPEAEVEPELESELEAEPEVEPEPEVAEPELEALPEPEPEVQTEAVVEAIPEVIKTPEPEVQPQEPAEEVLQHMQKKSDAEIQLEMMKKEMMKEEHVMDTMTTDNTIEEVASAVTTPEAPVVTKEEISDEVSVITAGTKIRGNMETTGSFEIEGTIEGDIKCNGKLTVIGTVVGNSASSEFFADSAHIEGEVVSSGTVKVGLGSVIIGNITATSAVVAGAVKGDIDVQGPVVVDTSAVIMGNIKSRSVQINNGAVIEGFCSQCYSDVDVESLFSKKN